MSEDDSFEVSPEQAIEWARAERAAVERDPRDTLENRKRLFVAFLLFSFADSMSDGDAELPPITPKRKDLN